MKKLLKTLLILFIVGGLAAGGVYGYSRYTMSQPVQVQPVANWLLDYSPNQTYLGGSVISGDNLILYGQRDRKPVDIYVEEGQQVNIGTPLLRYDTTKDTLELDEKLLSRQKLYDSLEALYKEYRRYAYKDYERTIPTATPTLTPTPKAEGEAARNETGLGITRLSSSVWQDVKQLNGKGTEEDPYLFELRAMDGVSDPIPESLMMNLQAQAANTRKQIFAWFKTSIGYLHLRFLPPESLGGKGTFYVAAAMEKIAPTDVLEVDPLAYSQGNGSKNAPYLYSYTEGKEIPGAFFSYYMGLASTSADVYIYNMICTELQGRRLTVDADFTSMGTCILRLKTTPQVTPSPTHSPTPTPTPTPTATPTATPEGWVDEPPTSFIPYRSGMSRAERVAYLEQLAQEIRDDELSYRQLCHDIEQLLATTGQNGVVYSTFNGMVSVLNPQARPGEKLLEVRGGSGRNVIRCLLGETELTKYPVGTELTGYSYDIGDNITARVTYVGNMPITESYSNGGNPNSSGYIMLLEAVGDVELPLYSYVEFTSFEPLSKTGAIYLYEAFVREIDGQDCIFIVRDGFLKKVQVHTGRRTMEYIELVGSDLTGEDLIAFPYGKNIRDGAPVEVVDSMW